MKQEREKGVLDVDTKVPTSITAHAAGYIDRDLEQIVGLQTDRPLKRTIMPFGGIRVVKAGLEAYGYQLDRQTEEIFTKYRKTHNDGVLMFTRARCVWRDVLVSSQVCQMRMDAGGSSVTIGALLCTV
jgi:pyruvate-formate lyase